MKANCMVVGMPRSGTTWIAKVIDSHPDVLYFHEPDSANPLRNVPLFSGEYTESDIQAVRHFLAQFPYVRSKCLGKQPYFDKQYLNKFEHTLMKGSLMASKVLGDNWIYFPDEHAEQAKYIVFKSIESVGRLGAFLEADKDLKVIFIVRSPFGQINSVLKGLESDQFDHNELSEETVPLQDRKKLYAEFGSVTEAKDLPIDDLDAYQQLAYRWMMFNEKAFKEAQLFADRVKLVVYDEFCDDPMQQAADIFEFLGLPFSLQSQNFIYQSTHSHDKSYYSVNKDSNKAKSAWRSRFTDQNISAINEVIQYSSLFKKFQ